MSIVCEPEDWHDPHEGEWRDGLTHWTKDLQVAPRPGQTMTNVVAHNRALATTHQKEE